MSFTSPGRRPKLGYFLLEGINSFATVFYSNYLFFAVRERFHFDNRDCLALAALNGGVYMVTAWFAGQYAQKRGCFSALRLGYGGMTAALAFGLWATSATGQVIASAGWTFFLCFTWPALEALIADHETPEGTRKIIGVYNIIWAVAAAVGYFSGGAILQHFGWGCLLTLPLGLQIVQWAMLGPLEARARAADAASEQNGLEGNAGGGPSAAVPVASEATRATAETFKKLGWIANPFAYVAIHSIIPLLPDLATRLQLSTAQSGVFCSLWMFARLSTFALLWRWSRWHYRMHLLLLSYVLLAAGYLGVLLAQTSLGILLSQVVFGWATGFIYYSSLYYSMDASDTKGAHGGVHEAALGVGIFCGPAIGATALRFLPLQPQANTWAVGGILSLGLVVLWTLRARPAGDVRKT